MYYCLYLWKRWNTVRNAVTICAKGWNPFASVHLEKYMDELVWLSIYIVFLCIMMYLHNRKAKSSVVVQLVYFSNYAQSLNVHVCIYMHHIYMSDYQIIIMLMLFGVSKTVCLNMSLHVWITKVWRWKFYIYNMLVLKLLFLKLMLPHLLTHILTLTYSIKRTYTRTHKKQSLQQPCETEPSPPSKPIFMCTTQALKGEFS